MDEASAGLGFSNALLVWCDEENQSLTTEDTEFHRVKFIRAAVPSNAALMLRGGRLTDAFSKDLKYLKAAVSLHFGFYNFCRAQALLRVTPCMAAGITSHDGDMERFIVPVSC